ncbi:MAG: T9SS type A sorting domain-containing protein [Flavobacteriales bacterium]|nr:T9SS type A sorting domain-containing protein [Flavobacteriales bacterium]
MNRIGVLIACVLPLVASSQNYDPLVITGARWLNHVVSPFNEHSLIPLEFEGDTVINGETYRVIGPYGGYGAMREEDRRVWFMPFGDLVWEFDSVPVLLYDFNLQVGDHYTVPMQPTVEAEVIAKDSVQLMDGTYRDRWVFAPNQAFLQEWVESIGDPVYVLSSVNPFWETGIWLECYGVNNNALYGSCLFLGEVDATIGAEEVFRVLPIHAPGLFTLQGPIADVQEVRVYDMNGRLIWQHSGPVDLIDLSAQGPGLYLLNVTAHDRRTVLRVTVMYP